MASLIVRNLEDSLKLRLRSRAAEHGRSMEAEARAILRSALTEEEASGRSLADLAMECFGPAHGFDLAPYLPAREPMREPPDFED